MTHKEKKDRRIRRLALIIAILSVAVAFFPQLNLVTRILVPVVGLIVSAIMAILTWIVIQ